MEITSKKHINKIGIITLYYNNLNYGGLLQAYALCRAIEGLGFRAEQICVAQDATVTNRYRLKSMKTPKGIASIAKNVVARAKKIWFTKKLHRTNLPAKEFMDAIPHSSEVYTCRTIHNANREYDAFVCGSDQVWNLNYFKGEEALPYLLKFVEKEKRTLSYAASVGVSLLSERQQQALNDAVKRLDYVSLREDSAKNLFDKNLNKKLEVTLDPTLLLNDSAWRQVEKSLDTPDHYIYCYFLGNNKKNRRIAKSVAKHLGLPIVTVPHIGPDGNTADIRFGDVRIADAGPCEFLYLIDHADLVLTDSFHACAFSMQFKRPFFAFPRDRKKNAVSLHSRIYDFADKFGLTKQLVLNPNENVKFEYMKIDWTQAYHVLEQEREKSMNYLRNALSEIND